jgi:hypothetical protein
MKWALARLHTLLGVWRGKKRDRVTLHGIDMDLVGNCAIRQPDGKFVLPCDCDFDNEAEALEIMAARMAEARAAKAKKEQRP